MTEDVDKTFFDVIVQLKEIDPEAYYKILNELGYDNDDQETQFIWFRSKDLKRTLKLKRELNEKIPPRNKTPTKKVTRSLSNLLKVEMDLKKMNVELKKVVKKVKTLEKENSKLQKKLNKK